MRQNFYSLLGLTDFAPSSEIEAAYQNALMRFSGLANVSESKVSLLKNAYNQLSDPIRKGVYDAALRQGNEAQFHPNLGSPIQPIASKAGAEPTLKYSWRWMAFFTVLVLGGFFTIWFRNLPAPHSVPAPKPATPTTTNVSHSTLMMTLANERLRLQNQALKLEEELKGIEFKLNKAFDQLEEGTLSQYAYELLDREMEARRSQIEAEQTQIDSRIRAINDELRRLAG